VGRGVKVTSAQIVGERMDRADIVVTPYPSDHRAVVASVTWDN
jgi:exodeoxyribonuclease-3